MATTTLRRGDPPPGQHAPHCRAKLDAAKKVLDRSCRACRDVALHLTLTGAKYDTLPAPAGRGWR